MLQVGDIVKGLLWPEIVEIKKCERIQESFYRVEAYGKDTNQYYQVMVVEDQLGKLEVLNRSNDKLQLTEQDVQHYLLYKEFVIDQKFSKTRALGDKNVIPLPHQIEAVYGRMLQAPQVRFLLADDPGAGKTIMAGMLIKELKARRSADRILILVPPLVLKQWQQELSVKFRETFTIITRSALAENDSNNPFVEHDFVLSSIYWTAREDIKSLVMEADFDLVIVDEAHKMAAYTRGGKKKQTKRTKIYQLGESILRHSKHCLLLTATPHKGDAENFRHLMKLVDEDIFSSIGVKETLKDKANPFIIRRLKENLKYFDGSPLFPKRMTRTINYDLSPKELELYEAVTMYVKDHFNRAINRGSNSTAFAMMLLQRRLSSSIEAIYSSLNRRHERLTLLLEEVTYWETTTDSSAWEDYDDATLEEQELIEEESENLVDSINPNELKLEIRELESLIYLASDVRHHHIERKYIELESTLFGKDGLLKRGEKILIFTESLDTLSYLESKLSKHGLGIAKIIGKYSMDERRRQVEMFKHDVPIMLATDAGGESINLQFCNQMINYDIPWNPNKLEQRMGRIHRIGQRNEVFAFNLVAGNTREGDVLITLLKKMDQMRTDLGHDLVYDFIGDRIEDKITDLPKLMQQAILNRERIEDMKQELESVLSQEYQELLRVAKEELLADDSINLRGLKREQYDLLIQRVPVRIYSEFTVDILNQNRVKVHLSHNNQVFRIERLPKSVRDFARTHHIYFPAKESSYRFSYNDQLTDKHVALMLNDHPLFLLAAQMQKNQSEGMVLPTFELKFPVKETLEIEGYEVSLTNGTGRELYRDILYFAKRASGEIVEIDSYWLFSHTFTDTLIKKVEMKPYQMFIRAMATVMKEREKVVLSNEAQLNKKLQFLRRAFDSQYQQTTDKLNKYRMENDQNKNAVLINQSKAQLIDIEDRRKARIEEVERERNINIIPPNQIVQLKVLPNEAESYRIFPTDYKNMIQFYEVKHKRNHIRIYPAFSLVDFMSEDDQGNVRFIIVVDKENISFSKKHLEDLKQLENPVYVYFVCRNEVISVNLL
ncbi:DEAD/DEAH box helicase [Priestia megaterium]|uniref:DEAD/DEAH box helicase n=1 Tax=Priestia megaterium TaxID=1404 RepID=UPI000BFD64FE|nr:helicase-related protein [Priestia megaterium]PGQ79702.1 helicase [Priestia megaterium]